MKQAIAGVAPPELEEVTIMVVWPTIAITGLGRFLGRCFQNRTGIGNVLTIGNILKLATIPITLGLFFLCLAPGFNRRYRLTNRRLIIDKGVAPHPQSWVSLDDFDAIDVLVLPGYEFYFAGDMIFRKGAVETFRILAVSRPESFKQVCLKAQRSYVSVRKAVAQQTPVAV